MTLYPRPDYGGLARYAPDQSPIAHDLSDNRNLWGAHPAALEVLNAASDANVARYPAPYGNEVIEAVARMLDIGTDCITTGGGGSGVLDATMRAYGPTEFRFLAPGWPAAGALARMNSHTLQSVPWSEGLDDPQRLTGSKSAIVFVPNPNNPTSVSVSDEWIREVQRYTERNGSLLILDEAYGEYNRPLGDRTPFEIALAGERTICVKTLSKAYGLAGLRVGYGVASPELTLEVDKARGPFTLSATSGQAGGAALSSNGGWLTNVVTETRTNRERLLSSLEHREYGPPESGANFVFIPMEATQAQDVAGRLSKLGVRTRPFADSAPGGSGLRATVGPWEGMQRLLDGLDLVRGGSA
ncbi:MAG: pyridoxal phosphate-dependent aminotransferase [Longimicrobiales bacterium]